MNKKFSTLVAALLLSTTVGTFTAQAQLIDPASNTGNIKLAYDATLAPGLQGKGYENGKSYLLRAADENFISVEWNDTKKVWELVKKSNTSTPGSLPELYQMMWTVQVVENAGAEPLYTFINKYTQTVLSVDVATATLNAQVVDATGNVFANDKSKDDLSFTMDGAITMFHSAASYKQPAKNQYIYANVGNDEVVYLTAEGNWNNSSMKIYARKAKKADFEAIKTANTALQITPYKMGEVVLSANDLNTMLYAGLPASEAKATDYFDLSFNPNLASVFTDSKLQAVAVEHKELKYGRDGSKPDEDYVAGAATDITPGVQFSSLIESKDAYKNTTRGFLALKNVKGDYLVVDTAYVPGTDNNNNGLLKFTTDKLFNSKNDTRYRRALSYLFQFTLNVTDETVDIESFGFVRRSSDVYDPNATMAAAHTRITSSLSDYYENNYVKQAVKPGSHWYNHDQPFDPNTYDGGTVWSGSGNAYEPTRFVTHVLLNTEDLVTLGEQRPATAATQSNIINIKVGAQNVYIPTTMANGAYLLQDVATGRYLVDNLTGGIELVEQAARQDFQHMPAAQWVVTSNGNATTVVNREFENTYKSGILYKGDASNEGFFYGGTKFKFIPVADATDKYLGYKWIKDEELNETRFTFNYLHDLAMDKPLNTINTKDSVVWVDKDGEAMSFSLVKVLDDEYGYNAGLKNVSKLNRRVYKIKVNDANKLVNNKRYLSYDSDLKKYVVSTGYGDDFLLKENNEVEGGECYFVLLQADLRYVGTMAGNNGFVVKTVGGKNLFEEGTINNVDTYVNDGDIEGYYAATWGKVFNASGLEVEGVRPAVAFVEDPADFSDNLIPVLTQGEIEALGYTTTGSGSNRVNTATVTIDGNSETVYTWASNGKTYYLAYYRYGSAPSYYADSKVSVDNNTLALVNGVLSDNLSNEVANSAFAVKYADSQLYRHEAGMENVKVFRVNSTEKEYLYEDALSKYSAGKEFNFLGVEGKGDAKNAALFLDTAYVNRETIMPQYMFVLRPEFTEADTIWCNATEGHKHATLADSLACEHTTKVAQSVKGWYLVNLADSVAAEDARIAAAEGGILSNKYQLDKTTYTRLGFVKATHIGDNLIIDNSIYTGDTRQIRPGYATTYASKDTINLAKNEHNKVAFSFRLVDDSDNFLIESQGNKKAPTYGGWIKIQNGVPVIAEYNDYNEAVYEAELFNLEATDEDPTANEAVEAAEVSVVATQGAIIVKGAAGKVVTVANILGQTIANQVAASDNVTIAAPAGVAVVTVDGEATKVVVK